MVKMGGAINVSTRDLDSYLREVSESGVKNRDSKIQNKSTFSDLLKDGILEVNQSAKVAEKAATDIAVGKNSNIHEAMLAATKAELGFNLMVQIRNKAIESYQEVMRMQV